MRFIGFLKDAFKLLLKEPKLFIPKILVAILYSIPMLLGAYVLLTNAQLIDEVLKSPMISQRQASGLLSLLIALLAIFFITLFAFVVDILVNAMYPIIVDDFYKHKKISLWKAFASSWRNFFRIVPIGFGILILVMMPLSIAAAHFGTIASNFFQLASAIAALSIIAALAIAAIFYFLYPTIMLENRPVASCLRRNFALVKNNKATVAGASLIALATDILSLGLSFVSVFEPLVLFVFIGERLLVTILFTYNAILNQVIYLGVSK